MLDILIISLATYRLSDFIVDPNQDGPGRIKDLVARRIGLVKRPSLLGREDAYASISPDYSSLRKWFTCFTCNSVSTALLMVALYHFPATQIIPCAFAASQLAITAKGSGSLFSANDPPHEKP